MKMARFGSLAKECSMDLPAVETMTYFGDFLARRLCRGTDYQPILPQSH